MALRNVLKSDQPTLREISKEVTVFDKRLHQLLDDLKETMLHENGVGLAAPQVGVLKRVCVVSRDGKEFFELINPVIEDSQGEQCFTEGCLSIPNVQGDVKRPQKITVSYFDRDGKKHQLIAEGFLAVVFCHEIDHLDGILFTDKMEKPQNQIKLKKNNQRDFK